MKLSIPLALLALIPSVLPGQATIRVDAANLPAAISGAQPGTIILVKGISAAAVTINIDKPLFIHADGQSAFLSAFVNIRSIPAGASCVFQGFDLLAPGRIAVENCAGSVLVAGCSARMEARNCSDLAIDECIFGGVFRGSSVSVRQSTSKGTDFSRFTNNPPTVALTVQGGTLRIAESQVTGGWGGPFAGAPAIWLQNATLELGGGHTAITAGNGAAGRWVSAVGGTGRVIYDRVVAITGTNGAPGINRSLQSATRSIPMTSMPRTPIGVPTRVTVTGPTGALFGLLVGAPSQPVVVPGFGGALQISPLIVVQLGTLTLGRSSLGFTVPNDPLLRGQTFRWQAGTVSMGVSDWGNAVTESHF